VLDAAKAIVEAEGAAALSTTAIAERAGISVGSLYQYFPDKGAILDALADRYLESFEELMRDLEGDVVAADDLVGTLIDAFAARYRAEPGYRALWLGAHLTPQGRDADMRNKQALADGVARILVARELAQDDDELRTISRTAVLAADSLLQDAFRTDPNGDRRLLDEAKRMLRGYLTDVADRYRKEAGA
jgi:AcrR family transcriptional regulator